MTFLNISYFKQQILTILRYINTANYRLNYRIVAGTILISVARVSEIMSDFSARLEVEALIGGKKGLPVVTEEINCIERALEEALILYQNIPVSF